MQVSYRTVRWVISAGLLGLSHLGAAQTAPTPDDSIKGRLWTATAERIWADTKPKQKQPAPWPTVQAFEKWLAANPTDKSELGLLRADVVNSFGAGTRATPIEVAKAIVGQVTQRQQSGKGRLTRIKVPLLGADLAPLMQARASGGAAPAPAAPSPTTGTTTVAAMSGAGGITVLPANPDSITNHTGKPLDPVSTFTTTPAAPSYFGLTPLQAGMVLLVVGALAGAALAQLRPRRRRHHHAHATPTPAEPDSTTIMNSQEYRKLQKQNQNLNTQLHRLQQQLDELKVELTGKPSASAKAAPPAKTPPPAAVAAPGPTPTPAEELSVEELVGAPAEAPATAASAPAATRYGPVQETPFVEERKIVDSPLPQLALMLTVDPRNPDQATFTLNPQVDQARLIGDGLTRLQKFFDYDPPLGGRITAVAAVRPGRLQRQASGWQVVERAKLAIS